MKDPKGIKEDPIKDQLRSLSIGHVTLELSFRFSLKILGIHFIGSFLTG